jgi:N-acetyl-alpha-D-glucosaminyl L-malate synthase BshA
MRIGILCHPGVGGSGVVACSVAAALHRAGDDVIVYAPERPFRLDEAVPFRRLTVPDHPVFPTPPLGLALAEGLARATAEDRLEVLHVHYAVPLAASAILAREIGRPIPVVVTVHGSDVTGSPGTDYAGTTSWALRSADAVTTPSRALAETVEGLGVRVSRVVPNFVRVDGAPAALAGPVVMHASNLRAVKRPLDLVEVMARVPEAQLRVVGDGPLREDLVARAREAGVALELLGARPDAPALLRQGSVFLLPSASESFGLAALEAMAAGLPVVATTAGGLPEVVTDGHDGFLHPIGDAEAMARSVARLLRDAPLRRRMGAAARATAEGFGEAPAVDAYRSIYRQVADPRPRLVAG